MEDLAEKLNGILSSPEGQEQLKNIAAMFGGSDAPDLSGLFGQGASSSAPTENSAQDPSAESPPIDMAAMAGIQKMVKSMNTNDKNTQLLLALKPHFSEARQKRVDNAVKMLRLMALLPMLKQSGILSGLI